MDSILEKSRKGISTEQQRQLQRVTLAKAMFGNTLDDGSLINQISDPAKHRRRTPKKQAACPAGSSKKSRVLMKQLDKKISDTTKNIKPDDPTVKKVIEDFKKNPMSEDQAKSILAGFGTSIPGLPTIKDLQKTQAVSEQTIPIEQAQIERIAQDISDNTGDLGREIKKVIEEERNNVVDTNIGDLGDLRREINKVIEEEKRDNEIESSTEGVSGN
jgi:hypothetical protein